MPLKLKLKPLEKIAIGGCVIQNIGNANTSLLLLNNAAVLREKDVLNPVNAVTVGQMLYCAISELYVDSHSYPHLSQLICELLRIYIRENPNAPNDILDAFGEVCFNLAVGDYYKALKSTKLLIWHEIDRKKLLAQRNLE
jgi:flagellar protein FlbT